MRLTVQARVDLSAHRNGTTLLEAIVALTLIGLIGLAALELVRHAAVSATTLEREEREMLAAANLFNGATTWSTRELDRRLGAHEQGRWTLEIQRTSPTLYELSLRDSTGMRELLRTALFRPEAAADAH